MRIFVPLMFLRLMCPFSARVRSSARRAGASNAIRRLPSLRRRRIRRARGRCRSRTSRPKCARRRIVRRRSPWNAFGGLRSKDRPGTWAPTSLHRRRRRFRRAWLASRLAKSFDEHPSDFGARRPDDGDALAHLGLQTVDSIDLLLRRREASCLETEPLADHESVTVLVEALELPAAGHGERVLRSRNGLLRRDVRLPDPAAIVTPGSPRRASPVGAFLAEHSPLVPARPERRPALRALLPVCLLRFFCLHGVHHCRET